MPLPVARLYPRGQEPEEDQLAKPRKVPLQVRKELREQMGRVHELVRERKYAEAKQLALEVDARCAFFGVQSVHVTWALAVINDYAGEVETAFNFIKEAVRMDPLEPGVVNSFGIITDNLRRTLLDPDRDPADETTPRLHGMLVEAGEADELVHLALARHLAEVGKDDEAMKVVDAVLLLSPACRDAWVLKATVAKKLGLAEKAVAAEAQAAALDGDLVTMFGIPGQAVA